MDSLPDGIAAMSDLSASNMLGGEKELYRCRTMLPIHMTPTKIRERLEESEDRVDTELFVSALEYVRDDGRTRR
ncbi:hypothetical protein SAMN05443574_105173 [Haloarcula vallismortis]|nr:hypothetical protein SAMN05443574_105173 [Haloarcula vallismortis]